MKKNIARKKHIFKKSMMKKRKNIISFLQEKIIASSEYKFYFLRKNEIFPAHFNYMGSKKSILRIRQS